MNRVFIIIGISLTMFLSSCSTYKAVLYPCDFNKYKSFRTKYKEHSTVKYNNNSKEYQSEADSFLYKSDVSFSVFKALLFSGFPANAKNKDDTVILTVGTTDGVIFPPHLGFHWMFAWDFPPKTATIIATDSLTGDKLFEIYYSRYMLSMDSGEFWGYIQGAVEYCIKELKNNPPKDAPREINIPSSSLAAPRNRDG